MIVSAYSERLYKNKLNTSKSEEMSKLVSGGFLNVKIGDIVAAYDDYSRDNDVHRIKVESIEYNQEFVTNTNPKGMVCYGADIEEEIWGSDYTTVVTEENFIRFEKFFIGYNENEDFKILICAIDESDAKKLAEEYRIDTKLCGTFKISNPEQDIESIHFDCDYVVTYC